MKRNRKRSIFNFIFDTFSKLIFIYAETDITTTHVLNDFGNWMREGYIFILLFGCRFVKIQKLF